MKLEKGTKFDIHKIAELSGTSKSTVSRVLTNNPRVSEKVKAKVLEVVEKYNYRSNIFGRALAGGQTGLIAVILPYLTSGVFADIVEGINISMRDNSQKHLLCSIAHSGKDYINIWESFVAQRIFDGIILVAPPMEIFQREFSDQIPTVICCANTNDLKSEWNSLDSVFADNQGVFKKILNHYQNMGLRDYFFFSGPLNSFDPLERKLTFDDFIYNTPEVSGKTYEVGLSKYESYNFTKKLIKKIKTPPEAIVCVNDSVAFGAIEAVNEFNPKWAKKIVFTGCDSVDSTSELLNFTSAKMPSGNIGRTASRLLLKKIEGQKKDKEIVKLDMILQFRN